MSFDVLIKRMSDGEVRCHRDHENHWTGPSEDESGDEFIWTEGNFACDCNRALLFARVAGEPGIEQPCGNAAYRIRVKDARGKQVYDEWTKP